MKHFLPSLILIYATGASAQGMPLPPNSTVKAPAETVTGAAKAFSGKWEGAWDGRMLHTLVVEEVKSNSEAVVVYAWQEPPVENAWGAGWYRTTAVIEGTTLKVPLRNGIRAWYELLPDGTLKGGYLRPNAPSQANATLRRAQP